METNGVMASRARHLIKALTWRVVATTDTTILAWIFTGNPLTGFKIGITEIITKTGLYYLHERVWFKVNRQRFRGLMHSHIRHLVKTVTWRFFGTIDTIIIATIFTGDPLVALKIGSAELVTKMVLYYIHERVWHHNRFGLVKQEQDTEELDEHPTEKKKTRGVIDYD